MNELIKTTAAITGIIVFGPETINDDSTLIKTTTQIRNINVTL